MDITSALCEVLKNNPAIGRKLFDEVCGDTSFYTNNLRKRIETIKTLGGTPNQELLDSLENAENNPTVHSVEQFRELFTLVSDNLDRFGQSIPKILRAYSGWLHRGNPVEFCPFIKCADEYEAKYREHLRAKTLSRLTKDYDNLQAELHSFQLKVNSIKSKLNNTIADVIRIGYDEHIFHIVKCKKCGLCISLVCDLKCLCKPSPYEDD